VLRVEDIDTPRVVDGAEAAILRDLEWLGLDWDVGPLRQTERIAHYASAVERLAAAGLTYPCDCSRAEIARVASAPHAAEEAVYPGLCRDRDPNRVMKRPPALRVRVPEAVVAYDDGAVGRVAQHLAREVGDFVLCRGDGVFAYQLAVVVDDAAMDVSDVLRGSDLVSSTPRQIWLAGVLGVGAPRYTHLPLVVAPDGSRLEKRTPGVTVAALRAAGVSPRAIVGRLAHGLGLAETTEPASPRDVAAACVGREIAWPTEPWRVPTIW
jgi:glutamyl-tRNA synthetase